MFGSVVRRDACIPTERAGIRISCPPTHREHELAASHPHDRESYIGGKSTFKSTFIGGGFERPVAKRHAGGHTGAVDGGGARPGRGEAGGGLRGGNQEEKNG